MNAIDSIVASVIQARAYKRITDAQGPSQQLIDFINYDGNLADEIGLEGFDTFSTQTQHEVLLSNMYFGTEGLLGSLFKKAESKEAKTSKQIDKLGRDIERIKPFAEKACEAKPGSESATVANISLFNRYMSAFNLNIGLHKFTAEKMPTSLEQGAWEAYKNEYTRLVDKLWEDLERNINNDVGDGDTKDILPGREETSINRSGWTPNTIRAAAKKLLSWISLEKKYVEVQNQKYQQIANAAKAANAEKEVFKTISKVLGYELSAVNEISYALVNQIIELFFDASKHFEITE